MPITVTPPAPGLVVGPGVHVGWASDFIGPLPTGSHVDLNVYGPTPGEQLVWSTRHTTTTINGFLPIMLHEQSVSTLLTVNVLKDGQTALVQVVLYDPSDNVIDTGQANLPWSSTAALGQQAYLQPTDTGGGLTTEQSQQLQQTHDSTWPQFLVDNLTLAPLTSGPTGNPVAANLTSPVFGVIVRLANVPADLQAQTPDGDYWVPTLAVVRIYRGSDMWLRVPIHTSSKLINLWVEGIALGLADAVLNAGWLLNLTLQCWFREGVTGEVFLMRVP